MHSTKGFSLIELLVVVAIIGVLAAAGVVGYQSYTDTAKNNVLDNNMATTFKAARSDIQALTQGLKDTSKLFENVTKTSAGVVTCEAGAIEMVEYLNINFTNPHNANNPVAAYGNASVTGVSGAFKTTTTPNISSMDRIGLILVNCNEPATDITNLNQVKLYQCACETSDCRYTTSSDVPNNCPAPRESSSVAATSSGSPFFGWSN